MSALIRTTLRLAAIFAAIGGSSSETNAADPDDPSRIRRAITYLDNRQDEWSRFTKAERGEGADKTSCVSCHTGLSYALARPALRPFGGTPGPAAPEQRMIAAVGLRVEHWAELDSPRFELMYDHDDPKKVQSRGTEAVLNALLLARDDANRAATTPGPATRVALGHLWATQTAEGGAAGSWDWLNFGLEPWEAKGSRVFGASLAAIAVGAAPGYLGQGLDEAASKGVRSLGDYLRRRFPAESLYHRIWILEASATFPDLLSADQTREVIEQLMAIQREDGGWALSSLGDFRRIDGTSQARDSDGYATGFVLHALVRAGISLERPEVVRGLGWLRFHQQEDGSWRTRSLNKERDPASFVGRLMSDAATAMAAQALVEAGSR